jgi:hypothetical protein
MIGWGWKNLEEFFEVDFVGWNALLFIALDDKRLLNGLKTQLLTIKVKVQVP